MDWLRRFWNDYSWLLFLPGVLLVGVAIILAVAGVSFGFRHIAANVPFAVWGSFVGAGLLLAAAAYILAKISSEGFETSAESVVESAASAVGLAGLAILVLAIVAGFMPRTFQSVWALIQNLGFLLITGLVCYAYVFVCGEFVGKGLILVKRGTLGGLMLVAVGLVGLVPLGWKLADSGMRAFREGDRLTPAFTAVIGAILTIFVFAFFVVPALRSEPEKQKDGPQ